MPADGFALYGWRDPQHVIFRSAHAMEMEIGTGCTVASF